MCGVAINDDDDDNVRGADGRGPLTDVDRAGAMARTPERVCAARRAVLVEVRRTVRAVAILIFFMLEKVRVEKLWRWIEENDPDGKKRFSSSRCLARLLFFSRCRNLVGNDITFHEISPIIPFFFVL